MPFNAAISWIDSSYCIVVSFSIVVASTFGISISISIISLSN